MIATQISIEHRARLMPHVDDLAATGDLVGEATGAELRPRLDAACEFLTGMLMPHMEAAERAYYPEIERLLMNRHTMTPMRHEHETIRVLVQELERRRTSLEDGRVAPGQAVAIRRALFRLHAILKVHLAEEQLYADIAAHGLSPEGQADFATAMQHEGIGEI